jgi:predicted transcriptional regulator
MEKVTTVTFKENSLKQIAYIVDQEYSTNKKQAVVDAVRYYHWIIKEIEAGNKIESVDNEGNRKELVI